MQLDRFRIARNAIYGAIGGLLGWALISLALRFETTSTPLLFLKDALLGALVGLCIGLAIGAAEQTADGWARRKLPRIGLSGLIGLGAGLVGLVVGEAIFLAAGGGVWPRAVGWSLFGLLLGVGQWPVTRLRSKGLHAGLGGLLGGLIGGATYERLSLVLLGLGAGREMALTAGGAVGLVILGACIGLLIGLVETILRRAWLRFLYGPLEGKTFTLDSRRPLVTLGRSDVCDILLRHDPEAGAVHAVISAQGGAFTLTARDGAVMLRNAGASQPVTAHLLQPGDTLQIGRSRFVFESGAASSTEASS